MKYLVIQTGIHFTLENKNKQSGAAILNMALLDCQIQQERLRIWQSELAKAHGFFKMRIAESGVAIDAVDQSDPHSYNFC